MDLSTGLLIWLVQGQRGTKKGCRFRHRSGWGILGMHKRLLSKKLGEKRKVRKSRGDYCDISFCGFTKERIVWVPMMSPLSV